MSQQQPRRPQDQEEPIKYGVVFHVSGYLAKETIPPQDAAMMQSAENTVLGQTQKGGPAAIMQSAAARNEPSGYAGHRDVTEVAAEQGMTVTETNVPGHRIISEAVGGQTVSKYAEPAPVSKATSASVLLGRYNRRAGFGGEASALTAGDKPVEQRDAAAIKAAEVTGITVPGGVASAARSAATMNARTIREEDKTKLADVLSDATGKLPADKPVTREDAEAVVGAELRNNPKMATHPGGVAASVAAAAQLNQNQH